ncbi:heterogeneous nuclear ribonucleoprotein M [Pseudophryne corroboree]|uniref:heterogeneous nuclear ribonucleoprotein M n=1 Tax=Pseudophryne corroboree TaxID=495146 RepID=UPI003081CF46
MASSALIKVKIHRNLPAKIKSEEATAAPSNGDAESNKEPQVSGATEQPNQNDKRKEKGMKKTVNRFEPYHSQRRFRAFISNISFDVKWQALKDLIKEKVGEVTYVELLLDDEGKSRGCAVVEFKLEESMKKAVQLLNKHALNGRPLKIKEDPDGEHVRRATQSLFRPGAMNMGTPDHIGLGMSGPLGMPRTIGMNNPGPLGMACPVPAGSNLNIPPSILNNPNIPGDVILALQSGRLGSTVFVANLDYSVGWKKLKEVFGIAGTVVRADILEDKNGKSRGIATVTYEQPIEAVQAISMFNGQLLFDRPMMVKMDDKAMPKGDLFADRPPQLPRGLGGIGMGLGPGGQPIDMNNIRGSSMGGPGGMGMDTAGFGMHKMNFDGPSVGSNHISRFGMGLGRLSGEIDHGLSGDRIELNSLSRSYGDSFDRGLGSGASSLIGNMDRMSSSIGQGIDRVGPEVDRMGMVMDRLSSSAVRLASGISSPMGMDYSASLDRIVASNLDRMSTGMGYGVDRLGSSVDRTSSSLERMGSSLDRIGSGVDRVDVAIDHLGSSSFGSSLDRMGPIIDRLPSVGILGSNSIARTGLDHIGSNAFDRMGTILGMGSSMGQGIGSSFDRPMDIDQSNFAGSPGGIGAARLNTLPRKGCQIFVRNLSFDCTWKMLKDQFSDFGHVVFADIKMENGKSKGCGVVKYDSPEAAQLACHVMNGAKFGTREIDVRMDRNA